MKRETTWLVVAFALSMGLIMLIPQTAKAQAHVCGSGPGPGERLVGMTPEANGVAATPLCVADDSPSQRPADPFSKTLEPMPQHDWSLPDVMGALAQGPDGRMYVSFGKANQEDAERSALNQCNEAVGQKKSSGTCRIAGSLAGDFVAFAKGDGGEDYAGIGDRIRTVQLEALRKCAEKTTNCRLTALASGISGFMPYDPALGVLPEN